MCFEKAKIAVLLCIPEKEKRKRRVHKSSKFVRESKLKAEVRGKKKKMGKKVTLVKIENNGKNERGKYGDGGRKFHKFQIPTPFLFRVYEFTKCGR